MSQREELESQLGEIRDELLPDPRLDVLELQVAGDDDGLEVTVTTSIAGMDEQLQAIAERHSAAMTILSLPEADEPRRAVCRRSLSSLRREPRQSAELVSQMILGEEARVLRTVGSWSQIQTADRYVAWAHEGSLLRSTPDDPTAFETRLFDRQVPPDSWIIARPGVRAREGTDALSGPIADLVEGGIVQVGAVEARLREIILPEGVSGWIPIDAAVPADRIEGRFSLSGRAILDHGALFLGLPYLWGGTSEKGFDCSGFVQRLFGLHGVWLPRDADQQFSQGEAIESGDDWGEVRDGDLAFFAETPGGPVTHVGILAAGGRMLHASTARNGVVWDTLNAAAGDPTEYSQRLAEALTGIRRVLPLRP